MEINKVPTGFRILIFIIAFIVIHLFLQWFLTFTVAHYNIWFALAEKVGTDDPEGFTYGIMGLLNLLLASVITFLLVRKIQRKINIRPD